ncbi:MAG TPA: hypothetical protein VNF99_07850 [Stellaceae bacterium]|nr:hypothetical protein [Stellaceae bacterium]
MGLQLPNLRVFVPESWGEVGRFNNLYQATFDFTRLEQRFVGGVAAHFHKAVTLESLALKLKPNLEIDRRELNERGYTPALNSTEITAVVEAAMLELYAAADCAAEVIYAIFRRKAVRGLKQSTRTLFAKFERLPPPFPEELKAALRGATWYPELRRIRDELTHRQIGRCNLDEKSQTVTYMHPGMHSEDRALIIEDIFKWLVTMRDAVNEFLGLSFRYLNSLLSATPVPVPCGLTQGRMLMRMLNPAEPVITFDSGICMSYQWFEPPTGPGCPFSGSCGAYKRTRPSPPPAAEPASPV